MSLIQYSQGLSPSCTQSTLLLTKSPVTCCSTHAVIADLNPVRSLTERVEGGETDKALEKGYRGGGGGGGGRAGSGWGGRGKAGGEACEGDGD